MPPERRTSNGVGVPCRHCLRNVEAGRDYLILAYRPFPALQPYAETGPIFLHAEPCERALETDVFHVSANTDPKGDRSKPPQDQDPDMMVHVVKETDKGIIVRGAKYETAAGYADQAFLKPTVGAWTNEKLSNYAVGGIVKMGAPGVKMIARSGFAGKGSKEDYPLANKYDEVDFLMVLDNVLIPWEDIFFYLEDYGHKKKLQKLRSLISQGG